MVTSVRYKFIQNSTNAALTFANFPVLTDGDDKQIKIVKHVLTDSDIGTGAGQTGHDEGLILDIIPLNLNVLWIQGLSYRISGTTAGGTHRRFLMDNATVGANIADIEYGRNSDGSIRVIDIGHATDANLQSGDIVTAMIITGPKVDERDSI